MTLCLIDLSSIYWQQWHASDGQEVSAAARATLDKVHRFASNHEYVAVCCDAPPYKRSEIYPAYKANREKHTAVALEQFDRTKSELARRYPVLQATGYEADDVIATALYHLQSREHVAEVVSGDKDLMQLVNDGHGVLFRSVQSGQEYTEADVHAKFGVMPDQMDQLLALMGDVSDNVPGIPGVGVKTAAELLKAHDHLVGVVTAAKEGRLATVRNSAKITQWIVENEKALGQSYQLVQLMTDAPIDVDTIFEPPREEPVKEEPETIETTGKAVEETVPVPEAEALRRSETAIVQADWNLALEPRDSGDAWKLAQDMHQSRMFGQFPNEQAILAVMLRGRALGFDAATSLSNFHVVEGRPVMSAHLIIGLVLKSPVCERLEFTESTDKQATWVTKRRGAAREQMLTYTIDEAKASGLVRDRGPWQKHRKAMLRKTCGVLLARAVYPDITAGLYCAEEFG